MKTLALIACSSGKVTIRTEARYLYTGALFRKSVAYARRFCDDYMILSAKHGLVDKSQLLDPYDLSLSSMDKRQRGAWGHGVDLALRCTYRVWPSEWRIVFLAGRSYVEPIVAAAGFRGFERVEPLAGMQIGQAMRWLDEQSRVAA